jgi:hypothetical protein
MGSTVHRKNAIRPFSPNMIAADYERNPNPNNWLDIVQKILRSMSCMGATVDRRTLTTIDRTNPNTIDRTTLNAVDRTNPNIVNQASPMPLTPTSDEATRKNAIFVPNRMSSHIDYASFQIPVMVPVPLNTDDNSDESQDSGDSDGCIPNNTYIRSSPVYGLNGNRIDRNHRIQ